MLKCEIVLPEKALQRAIQIRDSLKDTPGTAVGALREYAEKAWREYLSVEGMHSDRYGTNVALRTGTIEHFVAYAVVALEYASGYNWCPQRNVKSDSREVEAFDHECKRLLNLTAKVVHKLQQPPTVQPKDDFDTKIISPKLEQSAVAMADRLSLGAMKTALRAHGPRSEEVHLRWHGIRRRVKLKLSEMWTALAQEDEAAIQALKARIADRPQ
jgi:hypothetical protein